MGMLMGGYLSQGGGTPPTTLDGGNGGTVQRIDGISPFNTGVAIRFNTNGTVETGTSINGGAYAFSSAGNWINNGTPDNSYSVRCTNISIISGPGSWGTRPVADDSWISLVDAVRLWNRNLTVGGTREFTCTFEVRKTAGAPPATGSSNYTFKIDNVI